jgi:uncharacterized protein (TIGR02996 family)
MPEADSFLQAIIDNPDDDAPRLIYADWLDEHGDPERAEFIRLQCARAARKPALGPEMSRDQHALLRREDQLLDRHASTWQRPFAAGPSLSLIFDRGFIESVVAEAHMFVEIAAELFRRHPVRHVRLTWRPDDPTYERGRYMQTIAGLQQLARLRSLDLKETHIGSDGVRALAVSEYLGNLFSIDLSNNGIGRAGIRALVEAPWLANVTLLNLSGNEIDPPAARALAAGLEALERNGQLRLEEVYLLLNPLGQAGRRAVHDSGTLSPIAKL